MIAEETDFPKFPCKEFDGGVVSHLAASGWPVLIGSGRLSLLSALCGGLELPEGYHMEISKMQLCCNALTYISECRGLTLRQLRLSKATCQKNVVSLW
ncbi:MAG TPA: hypothetical protein VGU61_02690 [Noviherbaspirillum sp.]|uniref:hypothetical protein n=1 Tax=Noviherbaspirillum sp. TaxID=1926288 RepID=UPI002DDD8221|nr:hypothetical protein [Noviherbaspirillum sp.]HEV2609151.1 hypothetical protein [Noviherbaspirillum sp.]